MRTVISAALLAVLVSAVAGCSIDSPIRGRATKAAPATLFDPCTLPDDALLAIDVDPSTAEADFADVQFTDWEACSWKADWYFVTVAATAEVTVEEFRTRYRTTDFRPVDVGTRDAYTFRSIYESQRGLCDLVYPSTRGTLMLRADAMGTALLREEGLPEDPCAVVVRTAVTLDPYIPD